jgi:hypothetical protein
VRQRAIRWNVQLNVRNILDVDQMLPTRQINGAIITYRLQPRGSGSCRAGLISRGEVGQTRRNSEVMNHKQSWLPGF